MTTEQVSRIRNSKTDAIILLQVKYNRFSKSINNPGVDKKSIENILEAIRKDITSLESELAMIGL